MKTQSIDKSEAKELRHKAEEALKTRKSKKEDFVELDNQKLIHELQVHQIELEMQNEELKLAYKRTENAMEKYVDLYDFAPSGYITLSKEGDIMDLNFVAATLLGIERVQLKNTRFGVYVSPDSLETYNQIFVETFLHNKKETAELSLRTKSDKPMFVHVDALVSQNTNLCLITLIDITERKKTEEELRKTAKQLKELNSYFLDRELRMMDLKKEINELLIKSGCEKEYLI